MQGPITGRVLIREVSFYYRVTYGTADAKQQPKYFGRNERKQKLTYEYVREAPTGNPLPQGRFNSLAVFS